MQKTRSSKVLSKEDKESIEEYESKKVRIEKLDILNRLEKNFQPNKKQQEFLKVIKENIITICHGSAGTGKSLSALYAGLREAIKDNKRLILIRPVFESASQQLGFLPGELEDKLAPHTKAFRYVLEELIGHNLTQELIVAGKIKFEVLNYLRGATLSNAVIVCDEAQNMTVEEMILATTRIGRSSKIIFTGDFFQSDLRKAKGSIMDFSKMIEHINGVGKFTFTNADVVRNPILVEITRVWEEYKQENNI